MTGWDQNSHEGAFAAASVDEAAARFAAVLDEEDADVAIGYDWHGGYGHPDHVQVHRVLHRGAELAARPPRVLESTMNRDAMRRFSEAAKAAGATDTDELRPRPADGRRQPAGRARVGHPLAGRRLARGSSGGGPRSRRTAARPPTWA